MVVKRNQARLYEALTWYFDTPPLAGDPPWRSSATVTKGHGRLEARQLTCTDDLDGYLQWPGMHRTCDRTLIRTGKCSQAVTYALTSLEASEASAPE
jgi:hypothetical protein